MKKHITLLFTLLLSVITYAQNSKVIEEQLQEVINQKGNELINVNIILKSQHVTMPEAKSMKKSDKRDYVVNELKSFSKESQKEVLSVIMAEEKNGKASEIRTHWLVNAINCKLHRDVIYRLSSHPDIALIGYDKDEFLLWEEQAATSYEKGMTQNITHVNADDVWELGYTGKDVLVAIIDTGVNIEHIDLINNLWDGGEEFPNHGYNTYDNNHNINDGFGHGTHCAGIVCGDGSSGTQTGIAPDATFMIVKVMDDGGYGGASSITAGMEFALEHGADILNMSLGIPNASVSTREMMRNACINTMEAGIVATVAVGNDGQLQISFPVPNNVRTPGSCPPPWIHPDQESNAGGNSCCITVGAIDFNNEHAPFSSHGPVTWQHTSYGDYPHEPGIGLIRPDICAPGVEIVSADPYSNTGLVSMDGTSQAAPCVAGIICLMLEKNPELTPEQICYILETTSVKLSDNKNNYTGTGLVNALEAIENIEGGDDVEECDAPTNLNAAVEEDPTDFDYIFKTTLTWNEVENAESYIVYMDGEEFAETSTSSYIYGCNEEKNVEFAVITNCGANLSDMSEPISVEIKHTIDLKEYENNFDIYPNPVKNELIIKTDNIINEITIYNVIGLIIYQDNAFTDNSIKMNEYNDGIYFIKIKTEKGTVIKRFVKN